VVADLRGLAADPTTSIATKAKETIAPGKVSLTVPDEDHEGQRAHLVLVGPEGSGSGGSMRTEVWGGVDTDRLDAVCRHYGISALFVFGSVARGQAASASDIDLLYDLEPGARLGWEIEDLSDALAEIFGRPVDLVSRAALHPLLRAAVLAEARAVYAA